MGALDDGGAHFLLAGATGSGKTEVYLQACAAALERGRGAIVLVPEIALTPQTLGRFQARFGDRIAVLHSGLTDAERRDERERIVAGEAPVVVGARSAVFAPVPRLGLICVDEEHDASYKQESDPRYDARTVAAKRAALEGAVAVYGSATPRPESWERLERLELGERLGAPMPSVQDRRPAARGRLSALRAAAGRARPRRRATAARRSCCSTGAASRRRSTAAPAASRAAARSATSRSRCTRTRACTAITAATRRPVPEACPACGSSELARIGAGTQRLEAELRDARAGAGADPARRRHGRRSRARCEPRSSASRHADRAVLVGTQMVAKGHHFPGVSLAAVVDADTGLALPDFRAEERTFQLVTQLAGRSGRDAPGKVIVQSFQPDATPLRYAARHDVAGFLAEELGRRRELGYPPFRHLISIVAVRAGRRRAGAAAARAAARGSTGADLLGPAPLLRLRGRHRAQLVAKTDRPRALAARAAQLLARRGAGDAARQASRAVVDVDPQSL